MCSPNQADITEGEIEDYKMCTTHKLTVDFQRKAKMKSDIKNMPKQYYCYLLGKSKHCVLQLVLLGSVLKSLC